MSNLTNQQKATYAILADNAYWDVRNGFNISKTTGQKDFTNSNWTPVPEGWTVIDEVSGSGKEGAKQHPELEGFSARAYKNGNQIVIAYEGTDPADKNDLFNDAQLGIGIAGRQAVEAAKFYHEIKHQFKDDDNVEIKFTGHSLGGGLAGLMGVFFDKEAYIFDHAPFQYAATNDKDIPKDEASGIFNKIIDAMKDFMLPPPAKIPSPTAKYGSTLTNILRGLTEQIEINTKENRGFTEIDSAFQSYLNNPKNYFTERLSNLDATTVKGEFLSKLWGGTFSIYGKLFTEDYATLLDGKTSAGMMDKHSQTLLVASLLDENFEKYGTLEDNNNANINTLKFILDSKLYAYDQKGTEQNFLTKLVRDRVGGNDFIEPNNSVEVTQSSKAKEFTGDEDNTSKDLLTNFSLDLKLFADNLKTANENAETDDKKEFIQKGYDAMIVQSIEWYYHQKINEKDSDKNYDGSQFATTKNGYIQYTTAISDELIKDTESKVGKYEQKWITEAYIDVGSSYKNTKSMIFDQWNVVYADTEATLAEDYEKSQILINLIDKKVVFTSGNKDDLLFGGSKSDVIVGGDGDDEIHGGDGDDTLYGDKKDIDTPSTRSYDGDGGGFGGGGAGSSWVLDENQDALYGGEGNDTLIGGAGDDYLEGGTGFDTYIIKDNDTIHDSDGKGEIKIGDKIITQTFETLASKVWRNDEYTAIRKDDDLIIRATKATAQTTTIKDYFTLASTDNDTYSHLGINLKGVENNDVVLKTNPDYSASIHAGTLDKPLILETSNQDDIVFTGNDHTLIADLGGGNDYISATIVRDLVRGGEGNDVIYGSSVSQENLQPQDQPQEDNDILYGGEGSDLIHGSVGDDYLLGNSLFSHTETTASDKKGDWLVGGSGADTLFGSASKDLLQGGKDSDVVFAGANDDVILGDGNLVFYTKGKYEFGTNTEVATSQGSSVSSPLHPSLSGGVNSHTVTTRPVINTASIEYTYIAKTGKWGVVNNMNKYIRDPKSFDWDIEINQETGDYTLTTAIDYRGGHIIESNIANDFLSGGLGNDLIVGQYGNDNLYGGQGDDILWGDDNKDLSITGDDLLVAGTGADTLRGGRGFDTYQFSTKDLSDTATNTIIDQDNSGKLIINQQDWSDKQWQALKDDDDNLLWTDGQGNTIADKGDSYLITSSHFTAQIVIKGRVNDDNIILGMKLNPPNHAPEVAKQQEDLLIIADEPFSLVLSDDLFTDKDDDKLTYKVTSNNQDVSSWLNFDPNNNTLSGTAPINIDTDLTITATDPTGDSAKQSFHIISDARPMVNQPLDDTLYLSSNDSDWKYQLPKDTFTDKDGDTLSYQIAMVDGSSVPTAITIDSNTGEIHVNATQLLGNKERNSTFNADNKSTFDIKIIATDEHGISASTQTQLQISNNYIEANSDDTIMGATWGNTSDDVIVASDDKDHTIHAMMGDDTIKGGTGADNLYGEYGNDTLIGSAGDDYLVGGMGDDTYIYNKGDGNDVIRDWTGKDTLQLTDINLSDVLVSNDDNDILIQFKGSESDSIRVESANRFLIGDLYAVETIKFADTSMAMKDVVGLG